MSISCFCAKAHLLFHIGVSIIDSGFINWQLFGGRGWHRCDILPLLFGYYLHKNFRQFHMNFMNIIRLCSDLSNLPMIDVKYFLNFSFRQISCVQDTIRTSLWWRNPWGKPISTAYVVCIPPVIKGLSVLSVKWEAWIRQSRA